MNLTFSVGADHKTITGHERVVFTPDKPVTELVYRLWPNGRDHRLGGWLAVTKAQVEGHAVVPAFAVAGGRPGTQGTLLSLPLGRTAAAGEHLVSELDFTLRLPVAFIDRVGSDGRTAWWGTGFPLLAWVRGSGWVRTPGSSTLAEMAVSEAASVDVTVTAPAADTVLANGISSPPVAISGARRSWHFTSPTARDVVVAVGRFSVLTSSIATSAGPVPVRIGIGPGLSLSAQQVLLQLQRALPIEVARYGPYPFPTLTVADLPGLSGTGIEYPGMFLLGDIGDPSVTTHELTHMWFYGLVGDDQELHPWLDEAFATFGEQIIDAEIYGGTVENPDPAAATDPRPVDSPVSAFEQDQNAYDDVVYFKGALALVRARQAAGTAAFDAALRCYVSARAWTVATPADVAAAFSKLPAALAVLRAAGAIR